MRATPITSPQTQKLKDIRKLRQRKRWRERSGQFVAEGEDLLGAADAAGWQPVERYCAAGSGLEGTEVDGDLLARASGLASGTRALAVYEERWGSAPLGPLCVYLHGVHDPGNLGTILRSAEAFRVASVALGPETADPFSPKAVRASMGAVFTVPLVKVEGPGSLPGVKIALVPGEGRPLPEVAHSDSEVTLLLGAEREGLPEAIAAQADLTAHIPIATDSLNVAMAAAVALYELANRMAHLP
jgi:TrmH family RNA methyltransferase